MNRRGGEELDVSTTTTKTLRKTTMVWKKKTKKRKTSERTMMRKNRGHGTEDKDEDGGVAIRKSEADEDRLGARPIAFASLRLKR